MDNPVAALRAELAGADFLADTALDGPRARIRFIGRFEGEEVAWDAELIALAAAGTPAAQYLEVGAPASCGVPMRIGLNVPCIDRPTVLKAVIMVRNYKRLHRGRHEFGPHGPAAAARAPHGSGD